MRSRVDPGGKPNTTKIMAKIPATTRRARRRPAIDGRSRARRARYVKYAIVSHSETRTEPSCFKSSNTEHTEKNGKPRSRRIDQNTSVALRGEPGMPVFSVLARLA